MAAVSRHDEGRHPPGPERLWEEAWYFDFAAPDGSSGGYVRLGLLPRLGVAWYWASLVRRDEPVLAVRHHEVDLPRGEALEIRADGLWSAAHCETAHEHWSVGLEAFAVAFDDPTEAYRGERGEIVALGLDLEWEAAGPAHGWRESRRYEQACEVHGEILVGPDRFDFDGWGHRHHGWGRSEWWEVGWCWVAGRLADGRSFVGWRDAGVVTGGGTDGRVVAFRSALELGDHGLPVSATMTLGDLELSVVPLEHAPVRVDAPDGRHSRLARALCRFSVEGDAFGVGWTEWNQPLSRGAGAARRTG